MRHCVRDRAQVGTVAVRRSPLASCCCGREVIEHDGSISAILRAGDAVLLEVGVHHLAGAGRSGLV